MGTAESIERAVCRGGAFEHCSRVEGKLMSLFFFVNAKIPALPRQIHGCVSEDWECPVPGARSDWFPMVVHRVLHPSGPRS